MSGYLDDARGASTAMLPDGDLTPVVTEATGASSSDGAGTSMSGARVGDSISRYVVLEEVGRGGMGRVLRAYDPKLQREVALKQLRGNALGDEGTDRLVAEARAMAKLSHPNVVAVYDVEELPSNEVVIVMEYVAGQTLRSWLRAQERDWPQVIAMFLDAGRGLCAANEVGLLHRDFKPANVLVADDGTVKVTDFGVAKIRSDSAYSESASSDFEPADAIVTAVGTVLGTPRYMAPEQHRGEPLTAAADQYALCVSLWEALCGSPPFAGGDLGAKKLEGPPAWPTPSVPGPIAAAIGRGLSPEPQDRWPTLGALLDALAWDPTRRTRQLWLGLGAVAVVGLTAGGAWHWGAEAQAQVCTGARDQLAGIWDPSRRQAVEGAVLAVDKPYATSAWEHLDRTLGRYADDWVAMHAETCEATTLRGEQSTAVMDLRMACLQRAATDLRAVSDELTRADPKAVQNAHSLTAGLRPLERCADTSALQQEVEPPLPEEAALVASARERLAQAKASLGAGHYAEAKQAVDRARAALRGVEYGPVQTELAFTDARIVAQLGDYPAAEALTEEAMRRASKWRQWRVLAAATTHQMFVVGYRQQRIEQALAYLPVAEGLAQGDPLAESGVASDHASVLMVQGKHAEAEQEYRRSLALKIEALGPEDSSIGTTRSNLATSLEAQGKNEEAEVEHRSALDLLARVLGPDHPTAARSRVNLGNIMVRRGRYAEGEALYREAEQQLREALGPDHIMTVHTQISIGIALHHQERFAEAEQVYRSALEREIAALGPEHPGLANTRNNLAATLRAQGKLEEAETEHRTALAVREKALGPDHPNVAQSVHNLAIILAAQERFEEAEALFVRSLDVLVAVHGPEHQDVAEYRNNFADTLRRQGKPERAEAEHRKALAIREAVLDPEHPAIAHSQHQLARVLLSRGAVDSARQLAEKAWLRRSRDDITPRQRAQTAFLLARVLWADGARADDHSRARALAERALEEYAGVEETKAADEVRAWLAEHG